MCNYPFCVQMLNRSVKLLNYKLLLQNYMLAANLFNRQAHN